MFGLPEPIEIDCDAPSYRVVQACESLGLHSPLDVRWQRMRFHRSEKRTETGVLGWLTHKLFSESCNCGGPVPALEKYAFTFITAKTVEYRIGQCRRCLTIFWDEA